MNLSKYLKLRNHYDFFSNDLESKELYKLLNNCIITSINIHYNHDGSKRVNLEILSNPK